MGINLEKEYLSEVLAQYEFPADLLDVTRYGSGHINETYCIVCQPKEGDAVRFILQGLSKAAFPEPQKLMDNFVNITSFLQKRIREEGGDYKREALMIIRTKDRKNYYTDRTGKVWRLVPFIEDTDCYQQATTELFEESARAFGRFQYLLRDYAAALLHETIKNFHNTEDRFQKFIAALKADKCGRAKGVAAEIDFVLKREADCSVALNAQREGKLSLRVTHNDTRLNNVLFDRDRKKQSVL